MSSEEEKLTALYARRQEILKDLAEVDTNIKVLEAEIQTKLTEAAKRTIDENKSGNADMDKVSEVIASCVRDATGLRDALKVVEACRYVQDYGNKDEAARQKIPFRNVFVQMCMHHALDLANDANGSELMQHLVSLLRSGKKPLPKGDVTYDPTTNEQNYSEVLLLIHVLANDIVTVACNTNGARVSQRIIDVLATPEEFDEYTRVLAPSIVEVAKDINGNHSLSKLITSTRFCQLGDVEVDSTIAKAVYERVFQKIADNCIDICKNRQGCCIIQKCLQHAPEPYHTTIINTVLGNSLKLVQDPFGNYVVQFILDKQQDINGSRRENGGDEDGASPAPNYTNQIIRQMLHHVAELSCNKFSSNVIEKCLKTSSPDVRQLLVDELTEPHVLPKLLTDSFANYVIQTAISTASDDGQFMQLRDAILPLQSLLKNSPYGVKIEAKLSRRHRETARRQSKKKEAAANTPHAPTSQESVLPSYMPPQGMSAIPMMAPDGSMGQQMTFANLPPDMASLFQQQQMMGMPFMLQGQQMIGIPNAAPPPPPPFTMSVINGSGLPEYR